MAKKEEKAKKAVNTEKEKPREQKTQSLADTKTSAAKTVKKASEQLPAKPATSETAKSSGAATKARTVGGDAKKAPATKAKTSIEGLRSKGFRRKDRGFRRDHEGSQGQTRGRKRQGSCGQAGGRESCGTGQDRHFHSHRGQAVRHRNEDHRRDREAAGRRHA